MRIALTCLIIGILTTSCYSKTPLTNKDTKQLIILHTNDLHSNLQSGAPSHNYSPLALHNDETTGGFSRIAGIIHREKAKEQNVLTVDAGDFLMGTLFQALEKNTGFQLQLMKQMGYDAACIGNHEFDYGIHALTNYISLAAEKEIPELLLSNISFNKKDNKDDTFEELYAKKLIKPYTVIEKGGLRIGLFGLMGIEAFDVANAHPLELEKQIKTAKKMVKTLRKNEGVDIVIALSHSGLWFNSNGSIMMTEDAKLAQKVEGLDIIISGHTHTELNTPKLINNTIIIQAGDRGKHIGKLTVDINADGVKLNNYELLAVNDSVKARPKIQQRIDQQQQKLEDEILTDLAFAYDEALFELPYKLNYDNAALNQCNIGNFASDAINFYVNKHIQEHNDIALIGHGMIRAPLHKGIIYLPEAFNVASLGRGKDAIPGYPLARAHLTAKELKRLMGLLIKASEKSTNLHMFASGLKIKYITRDNDYQKIEDLYIADADGKYHLIDCSKKNETLYSIVADAYMLSFLGKIKKMSYGLVNISPKDKKGNIITDMQETIIDFNLKKASIQEGKVWLSLIEYAQSFPVGANGLPVISDQYKEAEMRIAPSISSKTK